MITENGEKTIIPEEKTEERIVLLDFLRGILMIWVILDHIFYDAGVIYYNSIKTPVGIFLRDVSSAYIASGYRSVAHPIVVFLFFFLSGIVGRFSKNPLKRAVKIFIYAVVVFLATWIFSLITKLNTTITIGVLYAFTVCSFCSLPLIKYNVKAYVPLIIGVVLTTIGLLYQYGAITFLSDKLFFLVYNPIGFTVSEDYFPVLPYLGFYLLGFAAGKLLYKEKKPHVRVSPKIQKAMLPVTYIGRTSLKRYFSSQVLAIILFELLILIGLL